MDTSSSIAATVSPRFRVRLRLAGSGTQYEIQVDNPTANAARVVSASVDGQAAPPEAGSARFASVKDDTAGQVRVALGQ